MLFLPWYGRKKPTVGGILWPDEWQMVEFYGIQCLDSYHLGSVQLVSDAFSWQQSNPRHDACKRIKGLRK